MWSLGAILFELLNGYPPFRGRTNVQVIAFLQREGLRCFLFHHLQLFINFSKIGTAEYQGISTSSFL